MTQPKAHSFAHPIIGSLECLSYEDDGILPFRGISVRHPRLQQKHYENAATTVDATSIGLQVLSIAPGPEVELGLIQHDLPNDKSSLSMSDTEGLCLNVTIPSNVPPDAKLPVFVFIHGGGVASLVWRES